MSTVPTTPELTINNSAAELKAAIDAQAATPPATPAPEPPAQVAAPAPPAPSPAEWGQLAKNTDGTYEVKLATGEVFKGTADEVIQKQAEAQFNTKRWGSEWKQKAEAVAPPPPTPPAENPEDVAARNWVLDQQAKAFGLSVDQYKQAVEMVFQNSQKSAQAVAWADFNQSCPDYVDNAPNAEALVEYLPMDVVSRQRQPTAQDFEYAHAMAKHKGRYAAAVAQPTQVSPTPVPPVMPSSGVSGQAPEPNPYTMPMDQLKKMAFGQ